MINWATLNRKVLSKFGFTIPREIIEDIIASKQKATELFLFGLRRVIEDKLQNKNQSEEFSNTDQVSWEHIQKSSSFGSQLFENIVRMFSE